MPIGNSSVFNDLTSDSKLWECQHQDVGWTIMDDKQSTKDLLTRVRAALSDRNLARVSAAIGLHENTVRAIANGKNKNPNFETLQRLSAYLFGY